MASRLFLLVLAALAAAGLNTACASESGLPQTVIMTQQEQEYISLSLPGAARKIVHPIPDSLLPGALDKQVNNALIEVYDSGQTLMGYAREITTEVGCVAGVCLPIHYFEVLGQDRMHL